MFRQSQLSFAFGQAKWEWLLLEAATGNSDGQRPILAYTLSQNYLACRTLPLSKHFPSYPPGIRKRLKRRSRFEEAMFGHNLASLSTFRPSMTLLLEVHHSRCCCTMVSTLGAAAFECRAELAVFVCKVKDILRQIG